MQEKTVKFHSYFGFVVCMTVILFWPISPLRANDSATVKHSFLAVGSANKAVIIDEDGLVSWSFDVPASDGWVLPSGNVLLAAYPTDAYPGGAVLEIDRESNEIVFRYLGKQKEISTVEPLTDGKFLVAELGPEPRAVVIDRQGTVLRTTALQCQKENVHMQTRMIRTLPSGNYLAPHLLDFAVKEYEPGSGEVVATIPTDDRGREKRDWPFTAIRLADGNTLISCTNGNRIIEVDPQGKIVWSVTNDDLSEPLFSDPCGAQRLPNGNTIVSSYRASGDQVKLFELTRDKQVVWTYSGMEHGFHHVQILTTNGTPLKENTWR